MESWKRTLSPETAASYNYQLFYLKNAQPFAEGKITDFSEVGVKALDDQTLEVTLENPTPFFLDLCATPPLQPVPVERIREFGDDWVKPGRIVGNGAYVLEEWRINDRIRLRKNTNYWNAPRSLWKASSPPHQRGYGRVQFLCRPPRRPDRGKGLPRMRCWTS